MTSRTIHAEPHNGVIRVFVRPNQERYGFHPWVLVRDMPAPDWLPLGCVPMTVLEYGPQAYMDVLTGNGSEWV